MWPLFDESEPGSKKWKDKPSFLFHPFVITAVVALAGSLAPLAPWPALFAVVASLLILSLHSTRRPGARHLGTVLLLLLLFALSGTRSLHALSRFQADYFAAAKALGGPRRCSGTAVITSSPTLRAHGRSKGDPPMILWSGRTSDLECEGQTIRGSLGIRLSGGPTDLARDDRVTFVAQLAPVQLFRNAALQNPWPTAARREALFTGSVLHAERVKRGRTPFAAIDRGRSFVRARILATYHPRAEPLARALVLGESDLDEESAEAFRASGLLHLLAVSGTHLVIAVLALTGAFRALLCRVLPFSERFDVARLSSFLGAVLSLVYADFAGGSGSAWRAAYMLTVVCLSRACGLQVGGATALGSSLLVGLALDPLVASDLSFLLSALTTAGLIGIGQPLTRALVRGPLTRAPVRQVAESLIATVSSTLPCSPALALMDGSMTLAALVANVVAGPLGELLALPACLVHTLSFRFPALEQGLAAVGSGSLLAVSAVARLSASAEAAQFEVPYPSPWNIALGFALIAAGRLLLPEIAKVLRHNIRWARLAVGIAASAGALLVCLREPSVSVAKERRRPPGNETRMLSITALDVGQGDAYFIDFPDGTVALLDGGGYATGKPDTGRQVILPYLRARGTTYLDMIWLSHPHPDHMLGLIPAAREIPHDELWIPGFVGKEGQLGDLVAASRAHGARLLTSDSLCGRPVPRGGTLISVLAPCQPHDPPLSLNDASMVLRIDYGAHRALFTGDIEQATEAELVLSVPDELRADFLKVAHHGSDTSSSEAFLSLVRPDVAFVSSGIRNRYGHPRKSALDHLQQAGAAIFRTDQRGSLTWSSDGKHRPRLRSFSGAPEAAYTNPHAPGP